MRTFSSKISINASSTKVWITLADIENWPNWAETFSVVKKLNDQETGVGSQVLIKQPKLAPGNWEITEWVPGQSFKWVSSKFALTITGDHVLSDHGDHCTFFQELRFEGALSRLTAALGGTLIQNYMAGEAEGLRRFCEIARPAK
jgi:uncharacterized membrane protein